jgi:hypothetical protein
MTTGLDSFFIAEYHNAQFTFCQEEVSAAMSRRVGNTETDKAFFS